MPLKQMRLIFSLQPLSRSITIYLWHNDVCGLCVQEIISSVILKLFGRTRILKCSNVSFSLSFFSCPSWCFHSSGSKFIWWPNQGMKNSIFQIIRTGHVTFLQLFTILHIYKVYTVMFHECDEQLQYLILLFSSWWMLVLHLQAARTDHSSFLGGK